MRQFSAAALTPAFRLVMALFLAPRGRHASPGRLRRRRSTRVRRYAPVPVPVPAAALSPVTPPRPVRDLAPPRHTAEAEDVALVRPYYEAHERELLRVQAEASTRLHGWVTRPRTSGDLLAAPSPLPVTALALIPPPRTVAPVNWDDLAAATDVWGGRRARQGVPA